VARFEQARPAVATAGGTLVVLVLCLVAGIFADALHRPAQALLLVVPVVGTAIVGGRRAAQLVAALATLLFSFVLPPVGSPQVRVADDVVALVVFSAVAFTVGTLVARRIDALERMDRHHQTLLRSVSHDLRTPLTAIRAAADELEGDLHDDAARRRLSRLVSTEAARLDRLVGNLLGLARIEGGTRALRVDLVDVGALVAAGAGRARQLAPGTAIEVTSTGDVPAVRADVALLEQVVANLLENALRHSDERGVRIVVDARPTTVRLAVADHGPGVPPEDRARVFEPFRSGANPGGSGLGLAVCKAVVELHGGTISVHDTAGGGATFVVELPLSPPT
jgi:two-component system sensor histidine kinase KdpD